MTVDQLITDTASRLFGELCTHGSIQDAEENGGAPEIWQAFAETGFPWISLPESAGGSGGTLLDALEVLRLVGYHAAPIPAAETGVLGGWLLASAGVELPEGIVTVAPGSATDTLALNADGTVSGAAHMVRGDVTPSDSPSYSATRWHRFPSTRQRSPRCLRSRANPATRSASTMPKQQQRQHPTASPPKLCAFGARSAESH